MNKIKWPRKAFFLLTTILCSGIKSYGQGLASPVWSEHIEEENYVVMEGVVGQEFIQQIRDKLPKFVKDNRELTLYFFGNWYDDSTKTRGGTLAATEYYPLDDENKKALGLIIGFEKSHFDFPCGDGTFPCKGKGFVGAVFAGPALKENFFNGKTGDLIAQLTAKLKIMPRSRFVGVTTISGYKSLENDTALGPDIQLILVVPRGVWRKVLSHFSFQFLGNFPLEGTTYASWRGQAISSKKADKEPWWYIGGRIYSVGWHRGELSILQPYANWGFEKSGNLAFFDTGPGIHFLDYIFDFGGGWKIGLGNKSGIYALVGVNFYRLAMFLGGNY